MQPLRNPGSYLIFASHDEGCIVSVRSLPRAVQKSIVTVDYGGKGNTLKILWISFGTAGPAPAFSVATLKGFGKQ